MVHHRCANADLPRQQTTAAQRPHHTVRERLPDHLRKQRHDSIFTQLLRPVHLTQRSPRCTFSRCCGTPVSSARWHLSPPSPRQSAGPQCETLPSIAPDIADLEAQQVVAIVLTLAQGGMRVLPEPTSLTRPAPRHDPIPSRRTRNRSGTARPLQPDSRVSRRWATRPAIAHIQQGIGWVVKTEPATSPDALRLRDLPGVMNDTASREFICTPPLGGRGNRLLAISLDQRATRSDCWAPLASQWSMRGRSSRILGSLRRAVGLKNPTISRLLPPWRLRWSVTTTW